MSTFIQTKGFGTTGSGTTLAVTFNNPTRTGNSVLVYYLGQQASPTSVTDGVNTYTQDLNILVGGSGPFQAWRSDNITGIASHTVTANFTTNTLPRNIIIVEHRNLTTSSFDKSVTTAGNTTTSPLSSGATATLTQNLELVVGIYAVFNGTPTGTPIAGFGHAKNESTGSANFTIGYADMIVNTTNAQNSAFTWSAGGTTVTVGCLTYKINNNSDPIRINNLRPAIFKPGIAR